MNEEIKEILQKAVIKALTNKKEFRFIYRHDGIHVYVYGDRVFNNINKLKEVIDLDIP